MTNPRFFPLGPASRLSRGESGSALIIAILLIMAMTVLGLSLMFISDVEREVAFNDEKAKDAYDTATSVLHTVKYVLASRNANDGGVWDDDLAAAPIPPPGGA